MKKWFTCPVCGYLTRENASFGTFEICPICGWEDDNVQYDHPDSESGANRVSLNQAKQNYRLHRVSDLRKMDRGRLSRRQRGDRQQHRRQERGARRGGRRAVDG